VGNSMGLKMLDFEQVIEEQLELGQKFAQALNEEERLRKELSAAMSKRQSIAGQFLRSFLPGGVKSEIAVEVCDLCGFQHTGPC
jgi:hypothetical protein